MIGNELFQYQKTVKTEKWYTTWCFATDGLLPTKADKFRIKQNEFYNRAPSFDLDVSIYTSDAGHGRNIRLTRYTRSSEPGKNGYFLHSVTQMLH